MRALKIILITLGIIGLFLWDAWWFSLVLEQW